MEFLEKLKEKRGVEFITDMSSNRNYDYDVENMSTSDGYEVWVVKERYENIDINENVFYYEDGAREKVQDLIKEEENITIKFWDSEIYDNIDWEDIEEELTDEMYDYSDVDELSEQWEDLCLPNVKEEFESDGEIDVTARRESWNNFLDSLCIEGKISESLNEEGLPDEYEE